MIRVMASSLVSVSIAATYAVRPPRPSAIQRKPLRGALSDI